MCQFRLPRPSSEAANQPHDEKWKAEQDKQRREQAIANTTGLRVLAAVSDAVPVRLLKRDLLFILESWSASWTRTASRCWHGSMASARSATMEASANADCVCSSCDEGALSRLLVEASILLASSRGNPTSILKKLPLLTRWTPKPSPQGEAGVRCEGKAKKVPNPPAKTAKRAA